MVIKKKVAKKPARRFKKIGRLPGRPSTLIRLALKDLAAVERSRKFTVDMGVWVQPNGKCAVCLAGAVMVKTLRVNPWKDNPEKYAITPSVGSTFNEASALIALDSLRTGKSVEACRYLGIFEEENIPRDRYIARYEESPDLFKKQLRQLATDLAKVGL